MLSQAIQMVTLAGLALAAPVADIQARDVYSCAFHSQGSICDPVNDAPTRPIGDHIGLSLVATGIHNSTGISTKLREKKTGKTTQLRWNQRDANGIEDSDEYFAILTSHNGGIFYSDLGPAFAGEGQLPCSLFDDNPGGEGEFEWLLTHYFGDECTYNNTRACFPLIIDIPALHEPRTILLKDNAEICGR